MKLYLSALVLFFCSLYVSFSQTDDIVKSGEIYSDAIVFKSATDSLNRLDVYCLVPYKILSFNKIGQSYMAKMTIIAKAVDSTGKTVASKNISRKIIEKDYAKIQSANGEFDYSQIIFELPKGKYDVVVEVNDDNKNRNFSKSRTMKLVNFNDFPFALSGILLVSSIEETPGKFKITPHISDNVGDLRDGFFLHFLKCIIVKLLIQLILYTKF